MNSIKSLRRIAACAALALPATLMAQTVLKVSDVQPAGYPNVVALEHMGKKLEAATKGKYKFQMFPGGVLGSEKEMIEQAQIGALQIARISLGPMGPVVPDVNVFNLPFVFRDEAHMRAVIDGPIGKEILDKITASSARLVGLGWMDSGSRSMYTKNPDQVAGRPPGSEDPRHGQPDVRRDDERDGRQWHQHGPQRHLQRLADRRGRRRREQPADLLCQQPVHGRARSSTRRPTHLIIPELFVMSKVTWDKMSKDEQALVMKLSREAQLEQRALWDKAVADYTTKLKASGIEFVSVDKKPFYDATAPMRAKYGEQYADLIKRIEAVK